MAATKEEVYKELNGLLKVQLPVIVRYLRYLREETAEPYHAAMLKHLNFVAPKFPGFFPPEHLSNTRESLGRREFYGIIPFWNETFVNSDGSVPCLYNGVELNVTKGFLNTGVAILVTCARLSERHKSFLCNGGRPELLYNRLTYAQESLDIISATIASYENGEKPDKNRIMGKKMPPSITEPYMQILAGGTPRQGLTEYICSVTQPTMVKYVLSPKDIPHLPCLPQEWAKEKKSIAPDALIGNIDDIVSARILAGRYFGFISSILEKNQDIGTYDNANFEKYADLEWERKDEALVIAKELKTLYERRVKYLNSVLNSIKSIQPFSEE